MPGPAPTPTETKRRRGNPGKRPLNAEEPKPDLKCPEAPKILQGEASLEWIRITRLLTHLGLIAETDLAVITTYCVAWGEFCDAQDELNNAGTLTVEVGENGAMQPHAALSIRRKAEKTLLTMAGQLGLSPAARTRIQVKKEKPGDALATFLAKHK